MAEPLKGGQQFFSNYLRSFRDIVGKLSDISIKVNELVPKFSMASDNIQIVKNYGETRVSTSSLLEKFYSYLGGNIRIAVEAKNYSASANIEILINGVVYGKSAIATGTEYSFLVIDIPVKEEDLVECRFVQNGASGDIYKRKFEIRYDLVEKPSIAITM